MNIHYETKNLILRNLQEDDCFELQNYLLVNKEFLEEWSPKVDEDFYDISKLKKMINDDNKNIGSKSSLKLHIFLKENNKLIGSIGLSNIVYGAFLSCFLGYKLHKDYTKRAYMSEALEKIIDIAFNDLKLHRIEANIMPKNLASQKLVQKFSFENEGLSKKYLKINGLWEDHYHYVLLNDKL